MAYEDEEDTQTGYEDPGMTSPLQMLMMGYSTVTPEGKAKAAEVFGDLYGKRAQYDEGEQSAYDEYETQARVARDTLRRAREVLAAKKTPTTKYLEIARGFGAPTRAGSFAESISNYAGERIPGRQREAEWEANRDNQLLQFDQGMSSIDQQLAMNKLKLRQARRAADDRLMIEAMKIMGKPVPGAGKAPPKTAERVAQEALDKAYVKDYVEFIQGGAADATKNIEELRSAHDALTKSDLKTGPIIGLVPKVLRDVFLPKASATQEAVESTVQRSLRQILGPQFTAKEGESLLARVYNPRLPEQINAVRVARLIEQLDRAYQEKIKAADYFEQHGTLNGYTGKKSWSLGEFLPDGEDMSGDDDPRAIAGDIEATITGGRKPIQRPAVPSQQTVAPDEGMDEIDIEMLLPAKAQGGRVRKFAEGGPVQGEFADGRPRFRMPDGKIIRARPGDDYETVLQLYTNATGTAPTRPGLPLQQIPPLEEGEGAVEPTPQPQARPPMMAAQAEEPPTFTETALGELPSSLAYTAAGAAGAGLGDKLLTATGDRLIPGRRETPAQRRILDMLQEQRRSPETVAAGVRSQQKMGIPAMAMDDPALRTTADAVLPETGLQNASTILQRLNERAEGAGERTMERINQGLKPDEYFDELDKLKDNLYTNSKPLYQQAYAANPSVPSKVLPQLLNTPDGKKAVKMALRIMRNEGKKIGKQDAMGMVTKPSLEFLDYVKRGMDQLITKEEGHGVNYQATELGKSMRALRNALRDELDVATTPDKGESLYKKARMQYAGDLEVLDALQAGRSEFTKMQPQELHRAVKDMSFSEKDAYRTGAAQALFEQIESPTGDFNAARKVIGSPAMRKKLRVLFDNDKQYELFETALKREAELYEQDKKSTRRAEAGQELHAEPREGMIKRGSKYVPRLGWKSPTMWVLQFLRNNQQVTEKKMDEVLHHLKASTPEELADLEKTLGPKYARRLSRKGRAAKTAVAGAAAAAAYKVATGAEPDEEDEQQFDKGGRAVVSSGDRGYAEGGKVSGLKKLAKLFAELKPSIDEEEAAGFTPTFVKEQIKAANYDPAKAAEIVEKTLFAVDPNFRPYLTKYLNSGHEGFLSDYVDSMQDISPGLHEDDFIEDVRLLKGIKDSLRGR